VSTRADSQQRTANVTIVFLVYNRREPLRESLRRMLEESDYDRERVDVIVVDNASDDGSAAMVEEEFPDVRVIRRAQNCGVSGWNDGFAVARGDWVLALDDDCYLPPDGLRRALEAAEERKADLVSFSVRSSFDDEYRFDATYRTGLLSFWGCAVLARREVLQALGGYDPEIFVWANELELMLRFFDRGYRHLHLPEVTAVHMKAPGNWPHGFDLPSYRINAKHFAYIAAKLLRPRDAVQALIALLANSTRDGVRLDRNAFKALRPALAGFVHGLRQRDPVANPEVSRAFRNNFESYASPWWLTRPVGELVRSLPREVVRGDVNRARREAPPGRREQYFSERARYYPKSADTLEFTGPA